MLTKEDIINNKVQLLPTAKLSDAVRLLKLGAPVRGRGSNMAWLAARGGRPGLSITVDTQEGLFQANLLNEWDEDAQMYLSSDDIYNDTIISSSWSVVSAWIKDKFP